MQTQRSYWRVSESWSETELGKNEKSKGEDEQQKQVGYETVENTDSSTYLGSVISTDIGASYCIESEPLRLCR